MILFYEIHCLIDFKLKGTVDIVFSGPPFFKMACMIFIQYINCQDLTLLRKKNADISHIGDKIKV